MMTTGEASRKLGVTSETVRSWITEGRLAGPQTVRLRAKLIGGRWRVTEEWLEEFFRLIEQGRGYNPAPEVEREDVRIRRRDRARKALLERLGVEE
jgi:excisionase family DNA binding protein